VPDGAHGRKFGIAFAKGWRKEVASALVGRRVRVFSGDGDMVGRDGSVLDIKRAHGRSTTHLIEFDGCSQVPTWHLLRKRRNSGVPFLLLGDDGGVLSGMSTSSGVAAQLGELAAQVGEVRRGQARAERSQQQQRAISLATRRLVGALALGELDCPRYVYVVPDEPPGGWKPLGKAKFWFDDLHATQLRLVLVCAHTLEPVACGPDGRGYPIKIEKGWVKKFFTTFGPVIKVGLFAARAALVASSAGAFALSFLPRPGPHVTDAVGARLEHELKLFAIGRMLEIVGREMGVAGAAAKAHEELDRVLEAGGEVRDASAHLRAWTGESYRSLRALLTQQDPTLERTGLTKVVSESSGAVEWVAPRSVEAWRHRQRGVGGGGGGDGTEAADTDGTDDDSDEEEDESKEGFGGGAAALDDLPRLAAQRAAKRRAVELLHAQPPLSDSSDTGASSDAASDWSESESGVTLEVTMEGQEEGGATIETAFAWLKRTTRQLGAGREMEDSGRGDHQRARWTVTLEAQLRTDAEKRAAVAALRAKFDARFPERGGDRPRIVTIAFGSIIVTIESSAQFFYDALDAFDAVRYQGDDGCAWLGDYRVLARPVCVGVGVRTAAGCSRKAALAVAGTSGGAAPAHPAMCMRVYGGATGPADAQPPSAPAAAAAAAAAADAAAVEPEAVVLSQDPGGFQSFVQKHAGSAAAAAAALRCWLAPLVTAAGLLVRGEGGAQQAHSLVYRVDETGWSTLQFAVSADDASAGAVASLVEGWAPMPPGDAAPLGGRQQLLVDIEYTEPGQLRAVLPWADGVLTTVLGAEQLDSVQLRGCELHADEGDDDGGEAEVEMVMVVSLPPVLVAKFIERSLGYCTLIGFSATLPSDVADKKLQ
jgi:hypothetical protein